MKPLPRVLSLRSVVLVVILGASAFSQCNYGIQSAIPTCKDSSGKVTEYSSVCCGSIGGLCGAPGASCQFCSTGYGVCPAGSTGGTVTTANWTYDVSCCPPTTCQNVQTCSPPRYWQGAPVCACTVQGSPIIIDTEHEGFQLTSAADGVIFDIIGDGRPLQIAWTQAASGNAFLALDRNRNGKIDTGKELFGNITQQPTSPDPNGFLALAEFDKRENGGNGDGIIDKRDAVFSHLLLWIDENHDGVSEPNELHSLLELGVYSLALNYTESGRTDQFGNRFQYRAAVNPNVAGGASRDGRVAYDVFFVEFQPAGAVSIEQSAFPQSLQDPFLRRATSIDAILSDEMLFVPTGTRGTACPSAVETNMAGGTQ